MKKTIIFVTGCLLISIITSCSSSTQLTNVWKDESFKDSGLEKFLVLGLAKKDWKKKVFENEYVSLLKKHNVDAIAAWELLPEDEELTKETFEKYFKDENIDAVLATGETGMSTDESVWGGGTSYVMGGFYGFYISTSPVYRVPGYLVEEKIIHMKIRLFETGEGKLIWSASSKSYEPKSTSEIIKSVSWNVVDELYQEGFIK